MHTLIIGQAGMGKTDLLFEHILQEVAGGGGLFFLDPAGHNILPFLPRDRWSDVIVFDPTDWQHPVAWNPLQTDAHPSLVTSSIENAIKDSVGYTATPSPLMGQYIRACVYTLVQAGDAFAAPFNRCHLELDRKLILIDCDIDVLQDYSGLFGRYFIAQLLQLAQSRFKGEHNPVYIYIDECYYFLDEKINEILATCRKANMGITVAHQFMEQFDDRKTATAVMSLISTKFASLLYANDAAMMAKAMRTTPEFINGQPLYHFALSQLRQPIVSVEVTGHIIENMPQHPIPHDEMRKRYGRKEEAKSAPSEPPAPQPESKSKPKARSKTSDNDVVERSKLSDWLSQNGDEQP